MPLNKKRRFDAILKFSKFIGLYWNQYFELPQLNLSEKKKIIPINSNESDVDNIFNVNVSYDLKLKKLNIDNIIKYNSNMLSPYKKYNKFTIQIEYCGKLLNYKLTKIY